MVNYYDAVLGLIPVSVGGIAVALLWVGLAVPLALSTGALVAAGLIGHAMFVRTPVTGPANADAPSTSGHARQSGTGEYGTAD